MANLNLIGKLYIIATPIGNYDDITLRAIKTLREVDVIICEEPRQATTLLKKLDITIKQLVSLNEHNESEQAGQIIQAMFMGQNMALISDCGTPVFSDPGAVLIKTCVDNGIQVVPIPGTSSLMAALSILDFKIENFYFAGFLPRESQQRKNELYKLKAIKSPIVLMDTPYRLVKLLEELEVAFGKGCQVTLTCDLTLPSESIFRGRLDAIRKKVGTRKAEFMLIIHNR